jgi:magnesium chelatase subunit D
MSAQPAGQAADPPSVWADATLVAALCAIDPSCGGASVRAGAGPVRDEWLALLRSLLPSHAPLRRVPTHVHDDRLLGGLDLVATLRAGRPVVEQGLLAAADGGLVVVAGAERMGTLVAARLATASESGEVVVERDGVTSRSPARFVIAALDEGSADDERPPSVLLEQLAYRLELDSVPLRETFETTIDEEAVAAARARLAEVTIDEPCVAALCATALALGVASMRASLQAVKAARGIAALAGAEAVTAEHAAAAARVVLAPRATRLPPAPADEEQPSPPESPPEPPEGDAEQRSSIEDLPLEDVVLAAAAAAIPPGLLAQLQIAAALQQRGAGGGRAGQEQKGGTRGRPAGVTRGEPRRGARLNVVETLRAAAPWQAVRRRLRAAQAGQAVANAPRVEVRCDDFRVQRYRRHTRTTTIFIVDASGSAALHRLGEAKGAVELLLGECYVRRDRVALLAFRGRSAELVLPPTRSLVRAKRSLAGLPGGGGTPLAAGIEAGLALADATRRQGDTPVLVLLTDGRANVTREGQPDRALAESQALAAARCVRIAGFGAILVDTAPRAQPLAEKVAAAMGARYLPLPHARSKQLDAALRNVASPG